MNTEKNSLFRQKAWNVISQTLTTLIAVCGVGMLMATLFTSWPATGIAANLNSLGGGGANSPASATTTPHPNFRVGLVAGHWGYDTGAVCPDSLGGYREVDINYTIADLTRQQLQAYGVTVDLLKEFDDRLQGYEANALVSIHADTCEFLQGHTSGFKIAETQSNQRPEQAARLLKCLENRYAAATGLFLDINRVTIDMTEYHAFSEINPITPAVIIETGYMNQDQNLLIGDPYKIARGIADGIMCYLERQPISPEQ
ncbi:MAG: N-acetylmuramoyl-L-alanine amidase [Chloroflexota bacterium]|nr:N-acetylmuramoyl-L-alanine amidase [Chloroflexota bacterium]